MEMQHPEVAFFYVLIGVVHLIGLSLFRALLMQGFDEEEPSRNAEWIGAAALPIVFGWPVVLLVLGWFWLSLVWDRIRR